MPHVFIEEKNKFIQVHAKKLPQRPATKVLKRQRNTEYMKFLLTLEQAAEEKRVSSAASLDLPGLGLSSMVDASDAEPEQMQALSLAEVLDVVHGFKDFLSLEDIFDLRVVHSRVGVACNAELFKRMRISGGEITMTRSSQSRVSQTYQALKVVGSGVYGVVYRAYHRTTYELVAVKVIHMDDGVPDSGVPTHVIREASLLKGFTHPHIVNLHLVDITDQMEYTYVMEYGETDLACVLREHQRGGALPPMKQVARWLWELLAGIRACHTRKIIHRDLKPQNLIISRSTLKICDFGLARTFGMPGRPYTRRVVTLRYRAPEILLGTGQYGPPIDMWSAGCIMAEMATCQALFKGDSEIDMIFKIMNLLGTPTEASWPRSSSLAFWKAEFPQWFPGNLSEIRNIRPELGDEGISLLQKIMVMNPDARYTVGKAQNDPFFGHFGIPSAV
mmetsp:Transcript_17275/g.37839  ORF Transcript_17275/g.37839 Transcript_17275/m.37839 type:complete len:446 (-) Transcript_17275:786-2123(-)